MKLYTKGGDKGKTSLIGGQRVLKDSVRVEAYGTVDELNSIVGVVVSLLKETNIKSLREELLQIQQFLFDAGSDLAVPEPTKEFRLQSAAVTWLEERIDDYSEQVPPIEEFILPGGELISSQLHVCRTITRRAERRTISISKDEPLNDQAVKFLNRLSDYFFITARFVNYTLGESDIFYQRSGKVFRN